MSVTYTCLIVDDEPLAQELIAAHVSKIRELEVIACCNNAMEASSFLNREAVDLLFLDINMPVIKGIDFFKSLVSKPQVIFTTAHREYALEGFEVNALDYLLKPIVFDRFFLAIQRFFNTQHHTASGPLKDSAPPTNQNILFVSQGHRKLKVNLNEVTYIESFKDYIEIHTVENNLRIKENIGTFQQKLGATFIRVHRSYIVNTNFITGFTKNDVELNTVEIPIGSSYREGVLKFFENLSHKNLF